MESKKNSIQIYSTVLRYVEFFSCNFLIPINFLFTTLKKLTSRNGQHETLRGEVIDALFSQSFWQVYVRNLLNIIGRGGRE